MTIALNNPLSPDLTILTEYLKKVNESGWYTNFGPLHQELTTRLESLLGVENLLLVSNGTLAIQVACKVLGINKAITTPFSFVATSSSLLWQGIDISYCDIDPHSFNLCASNVKEQLLRDNDVDGIVATHVYGNPCDVQAFENLSRECGVKVVYDAAHAFGVDCLGQSVLNYGDASTLSFHATKVFHTVEGGAIVFKRKEDYLKAKQLINFGIGSDGKLGEPGINAKLNEYQCAVGLTLLDQIENVLDKRKMLFETYIGHLNQVVKLPLWHENSSFNGSYMPVVFESSKLKDHVKKALAEQEIQSRDYFSPSLDECFGDDQVMSISKSLAQRVLCLPLHYYMSVSDVENVVSVISKVCQGK
ncbi:DegT/DnrJ/EryC1/StrS family aminotransferase [Pseudoalteromonas sp. T1lg22]|uniref:DegT/DnrJ/EryC1/StrS family aminotransferase n=1 Tax=Pseudoalteromonas sp. T1lg22 TaxID=2077096 RepID=UPI000CF66A65|nr:DegT/DnrJ/EryC1/StrS family aminotransferase [Pseudoalteromonas sp. T1lg22]